MRNDNIALIHFLRAHVGERRGGSVVDAKAAAPGAKSPIADFLRAELHPPSISLLLLNRLSIAGRLA